MFVPPVTTRLYLGSKFCSECQENVWHNGKLVLLVLHFPQKAESLKHVQAVLNLSEPKIIKPTDTRWLSHEFCVCAILKELPALIINLQSIYDECEEMLRHNGLPLALK